MQLGDLFGSFFQNLQPFAQLASVSGGLQSAGPGAYLRRQTPPHGRQPALQLRHLRGFDRLTGPQALQVFFQRRQLPVQLAQLPIQAFDEAAGFGPGLAQLLHLGLFFAHFFFEFRQHAILRRRRRRYRLQTERAGFSGLEQVAVSGQRSALLLFRVAFLELFQLTRRPLARRRQAVELLLFFLVLPQ